MVAWVSGPSSATVRPASLSSSRVSISRSCSSGVSSGTRRARSAGWSRASEASRRLLLRPPQQPQDQTLAVTSGGASPGARDGLVLHEVDVRVIRDDPRAFPYRADRDQSVRRHAGVGILLRLPAAQARHEAPRGRRTKRMPARSSSPRAWGESSAPRSTTPSSTATGACCSTARASSGTAASFWRLRRSSG